MNMFFLPSFEERFETYWNHIQETRSAGRLVGFRDYDSMKSHLQVLILGLEAITFPHPLSSETRLIDVGSGSGLLGICFGWLFPDIKIVLMESMTKRCDFLRSLPVSIFSGDIVEGRAESLAHTPSMRHQFDYAVSYRFAPLALALEVQTALTKTGGEIMVFGGRSKRGEATKNAPINERLGLQYSKYISFDENQGVVIFSKVRQCGEEYPRRWSVMKRTVSRETS